jgi:hypothetical protein
MSSLFSLLAGFIAGIFTHKKEDKQNQLKYITEERAEWRAKIRELTVHFLNDEIDSSGDIKFGPDIKNLKSIKTEIEINLNPKDPKDNDILDFMNEYIQGINSNNKELVLDNNSKISKAISNLLKHDWERVKLEAQYKNVFSISKLIVFIVLLALGARFYNEVIVKSYGCSYLFYNYLKEEIFFNFLILFILFSFYYLIKFLFFYVKEDLSKNEMNSLIIKYFKIIKRG